MKIKTKTFDPSADISELQLRKSNVIWGGVPNEVYHSFDGVSSSMLETLLKEPQKINDVRKKTVSLSFGDMFHMALLEPDLFHQKVIARDINLRTKAGKEERDELLKKGYKYVIPTQVKRNIQKMLEASIAHEKFNELFENLGLVEHSIFFRKNGVNCRCRPDYFYVTKDGITIVDLKTTKESTISGIERAIHTYKYYRQAAFYIDGMKEVTGEKNVRFINFFVESTKARCEETEDNHVNVEATEIRSCDLEQGRRECDEALRAFSNPKNEVKSIVSVGLPAYAKRDFQKPKNQKPKNQKTIATGGDLCSDLNF